MIGAKFYVQIRKTAVEQNFYELQFLKSLPLKLADLPYLVALQMALCYTDDWYRVIKQLSTT